MDIKWMGIGFIISSAIISFFIAITVDMTSFGLGGLVNYFLPPLVGFISLVLFLVLCWASKDVKVRVIVLIGLCLYNIYVGLQLRDTNVPFPF